MTRIRDLLPGIYQADLDRPDNPLRAIVGVGQEIFDSLEQQLESLPRSFSITWSQATADQDMLAFLSSWLDFTADESWHVSKRRRVLSRAMELYRLRGTAEGIRQVLREFYEIDITIEEWQWPRGMVLGECSSVGLDTILYDAPDLNRTFLVVWRPSTRPSPDLVRKARALIDSMRPGHTRCYLRIEAEEKPIEATPYFVVGTRSTIGEFSIG